MLWGLPFRNKMGWWSGHSRSSSVAGSSPLGAVGWGASRLPSVSSLNSSRVTPLGHPICMSLK